MKHQFKCYPLGNADTSLILLDNGKRILFDYANTKTDADDDKRIDLPTELNKDVKNDFDVVAFTHADEDHVTGFSEYFYLEHNDKFQKGERKKMKDLWVPAAILLQKDSEINHEDGKLLKKEARFRLKNKQGVKVFSYPDKLKDWLISEGIKFDEVKHLIVNAGQIVQGLTLQSDGIEFFVHSPFSEHIDDKDIDRNEACIIVQATFNNDVATKIILGADGIYEVWNDIVDITKYYKREDRLKWDVFHISHHSSYKSLSDEKGATKTKPTDNIKWLFETQGNKQGLLISPSLEIPTDYEAIQPPHKQAANYYKDVANLLNGEYKVTMEFPTKENPNVKVVDIENKTGATLVKASTSFSFVTNRPAPKAG
jgi:beta-lactamase superfamily II metal-dependent hydrolase